MSKKIIHQLEAMISIIRDSAPQTDKANIVVHRENVAREIYSSISLEDLFGIGPEEILLPFSRVDAVIKQMVGSKELVDNLIGMKYFPGFMPTREEGTFNQVMARLGMPLETQVPHVYLRHRIPTGDQIRLNDEVLNERAYIVSDEKIGQLKAEMASRQVKTPLKTMSYDLFFKVLVAIDRERTAFTQMMHALDEPENDQGSYNAAKSIEWILDNHPGFFSKEVIRDQFWCTVANKFISVYQDNLGDLAEKEDLSAAHVKAIAQMTSVMGVLRALRDDWKKNPRHTLDYFADMEGANSADWNDRVYRLERMEGLSLKDIGPLFTVKPHLIAMGVPFRTNLSDFADAVETEQRTKKAWKGAQEDKIRLWKVVEMVLDPLTPTLTPDYEGRIFQYEVRPEMIGPLESRLVTDGKEVARRLFRLGRSPDVPSDTDHLRAWLYEKMRQYAGSARFLYGPLDVNGTKGYLPSDMEINAASSNRYDAITSPGFDPAATTTMATQLRRTKAFAPIKLELVLREAATLVPNIPDGYRTAQEVAARLGVPESYAIDLLGTVNLVPQNPVILEVAQRASQDPDLSMYGTYGAIKDFHAKHLGTLSLGGMHVYEQSKVNEFITKSFVGKEEAAQLMFGEPLPFPVEELQQVLPPKVREFLPRRMMVDGSEKLYLPDIAALKQRIDQSKVDQSKVYTIELACRLYAVKEARNGQ